MSFRGSKSRNKVSVGEPAEGSLTAGIFPLPYPVHRCGHLALGGSSWPSVARICAAVGVEAKVGVPMPPAPPSLLSSLLGEWNEPTLLSFVRFSV